MHFRPPEEQNDHKVTCGVNTAVLQRVLDSIQQRLDGAGVQANIITSGTGGWVRGPDLEPCPGRCGRFEGPCKTGAAGSSATHACVDAAAAAQYTGQCQHT